MPSIPSKNRSMTTLNPDQLSQPSNKPLHLVSLDSLRALAALYVLCHHAFQQAGLEGDRLPKMLQAFIKLFSYGHYAVDLFIVLSGFCLMLPIIHNGGKMKDNYQQFCIKRARRILPPYYLAMTLSLVLILTCIGQPTGGSWDLSLPIDNKSVVTHIFLIHDLFKETCLKINSAFWTISVEWRIYFLFPVIVIGYRIWGGIKTTLLSTALGYIVFLLMAKVSFLNSTPIGPCPHYLGLFSMGMLAADIVYTDDDFNLNLRRHVPWLSLSSLLMMLALPAYNLFLSGGQSWVISDLLVGVSCMAFLIFIMINRNHRVNKVLGWKPLAKVGVFSYSLYLIHAPLLQVFIQYCLTPLKLNPMSEVLMLIFVAIPIIVALSYCFFLMCEKPFLTRRVKQEV
jgi:peptidoglycan/LPS O-acetylase OafA/YrhL